jgi:hypothetical protein
LKHSFVTHLLLGALVASTAQAALPPAAAQAEKAGIKTCLPVIESVESFLSRGHSGNVLAFWDKGAPDRNLFSALMALENQNGSNLTNLNVMPSTDGQCAVEYTQTGYVPLACANYAKNLGDSVRFVRDLNSRTALFDGRGVQLYLSPAGPNGCLWMRKEIIKQSPNLKQPAQTKPADNKSSTKKR